MFTSYKRVTSGYSGAGGRFPAIFGMPVSPIVTAIGSDGRAKTRRAQRALLRRRLIVRLSAAAEAKTGSEIGSPSSRVLHELSRLGSGEHIGPDIPTPGLGVGAQNRAESLEGLSVEPLLRRARSEEMS